MPQSLAYVIVHIVFSTKNREPFITESIQNRLFDYLGGICRDAECQPIQIGGYRDHVHILCSLSRKIAIMDLVEKIKKNSSRWIKDKDEEYAQFYWQDGYGIFSINPKQIDLVVDYIKRQKEHHTGMDFKDEYIRFLKEYDMEYNEHYLWD